MTGEEVIKIRDQLKSLRTPFEGHWDQLCEIFTPFQRINTETPVLTDAEVMFDSTPRQSALAFANGLCSLIVPREEQWFEFAPPNELKDDDDAKKWYRDCSEIAVGYLEPSNFYEEIQQSLFESPVFGTCSLYCGELDEEDELCFLNQTIGTYYIAESAKGRVNIFVRELRYTAQQAAEEFGEDALPQKIAGKANKPEGLTEKFEFVHLLCKRTGAAPKDAPESVKRPWVDIVVACEGKTVVRRSGTHEFTFATHRYQKHANCVWGFGPGSVAKGDSRQLSFLNELADLSTEKDTFPPMLAPASMEGEIAQGALEVTYFDENSAAHADNIRPLHTAGRYDILKDRLQDKKQMVQEAFHLDLFKMFSTRMLEGGTPPTATEASLAAGEKLTQFSPVYGRIMNELIDVVLARVFAVLMRANKFPPPPASVQQAKKGGRIRYKNKIALAMQAKENGALMEFFGIVLPILQAFPEFGGMIFDALDTGKALRDLLRNSGVPERWIVALDEYQKKQQARAEAASQRAQLENAELASKSAANLSKVPPATLEQAQNQ